MEINPAQLGRVRPLKPGLANQAEQLDSARELRKAYGDFVGKTFFGQMLKAMRSTVDKPAYFHGGQAEDVFQSQLDQQLVDVMSEASSEQLMAPMFERQFPQQAKLLAEAESNEHASLGSLEGLRRH